MMKSNVKMTMILGSSREKACTIASPTDLHHLSIVQDLALFCRHIILFGAYAVENILNPMVPCEGEQ
jgi:hypothetical protein